MGANKIQGLLLGRQFTHTHTQFTTQSSHKVRAASPTAHATTRLRIIVIRTQKGAMEGPRRDTYIRLMVSLRASVWASECQGCLRDWSCPVAARGGAPSLVICTPNKVLIHTILKHAQREKEGLLTPDAHEGLHPGNRRQQPPKTTEGAGPCNRSHQPSPGLPIQAIGKLRDLTYQGRFTKSGQGSTANW